LVATDLAIEAGAEQQETKLPEEYEEFAQLFSDEAACYGRLAVVSDVDDGGFALNVDKELRGSSVLYRSKYNGAMLGSRWT
jgi:hypothetical protein